MSYNAFTSSTGEIIPSGDVSLRVFRAASSTNEPPLPLPQNFVDQPTSRPWDASLYGGLFVAPPWPPESSPIAPVDPNPEIASLRERIANLEATVTELRTELFLRDVGYGPADWGLSQDVSEN
jgi:hypothetical protein